MASQFYAQYIPPVQGQTERKEDEPLKLKRKLEDLESSRATLHSERPLTKSKKQKRQKPSEASRLVEHGQKEGEFSKESNEAKKRRYKKTDRAPGISPNRNTLVSGIEGEAALFGAAGKVDNGPKAKKDKNLDGNGAEDSDTFGTKAFTESRDMVEAREDGIHVKSTSNKKKAGTAVRNGEGEGYTDNEWDTSQGNKPKELWFLESRGKGGKGKRKSKTREGDLPCEATEPGGDMEGDAKYKSILSKFKRSAQISETLVKESPNETNGGLPNQEQTELQGLVPLPQPDEVPDSSGRPAFSTLPSWLAHPITVSSNSTTPFRDLQLNAKLVSSLESKGYREAFAVQSVVLPMLLPGPTQYMGDLCISAATGSGKTLAYVLPMVESLRDRTFTRLRGLIIVPTRELVVQAKEVCELCSIGSSLSVGVAVGNRPLRAERDLLIKRGQKYDPQTYKEMQKTSADAGNDSNYDSWSDSDLEDNFVTLPEHVANYASKVDILVCTPGRLVDHIRTTPGFTLEDLQWLIIDEADRLLDQSFQEWADVVLRAVENTREYGQMKAHEQILIDMGFRPPKNNTRKIVLSATMARDISKLSALKLRMPKLIVVDSHGSTRLKLSTENRGGDRAESQDETEADAFGLPQTLREWAIAAGDGNEKPLYLLQLLQTELLVGRDRSGATTSTSPKDVTSPVSLSETSSGEYSMSGDESETTSSESSASDESETSSSEASTSDDESEASNRVSASDDESETSPSRDSTSDGDSESIPSHALSPPASTPSPNSKSADDSTSLSAKAQVSSNTSPDKANKIGGILIFTKSNESAIRLSRLLSLLHPPLASHIGTLTGSIPSSARRKMLAAFRASKLSILLASDLVARGLDVKNITHIVNYDLPKSIKGYVHRVGRTARAGREGGAWTLITEKEAKWFWKEIGHGTSVRRSERQKVVRVKLDLDALGPEARKRYQEALDTLKSEVRGGVSSR
ncbi:hypothetical protein FGG08_003992 [Glutinoglossum americanum]|uniref:ATP-dependent RNA helicase n=1 Tax=Glutinoglossum americanum TaxID=1670608 RepID=A0A9P8IC73_9PEZI|nr:hypothetical protein FGG08_003992 [Glutinoglossum americanum]